MTKKINKIKNFVLLATFIEFSFLALYMIKLWAVSLGVDDLYLKDNRIFITTLIVMGVAFFLYVQIYRRFLNELNFKVIFIFSLIINGSLLFIWNTATNDLYSYVIRARIFTIYDANPYLVAFDHFPGDAFQIITTYWARHTNTYGPIFVLFSGAISFSAKDIYPYFGKPRG